MDRKNFSSSSMGVTGYAAVAGTAIVAGIVLGFADRLTVVADLAAGFFFGFALGFVFGLPRLAGAEGGSAPSGGVVAITGGVSLCSAGDSGGVDSTGVSSVVESGSAAANLVSGSFGSCEGTNWLFSAIEVRGRV